MYAPRVVSLGISGPLLSLHNLRLKRKSYKSTRACLNKGTTKTRLEKNKKASSSGSNIIRQARLNQLRVGALKMRLAAAKNAGDITEINRVIKDEHNNQTYNA